MKDREKRYMQILRIGIIKEGDMIKVLRVKKRLLFLLIMLSGLILCINTEVYADRSNGMGNKVITGGKRDFKWPVPSSNTISSCFLDLIGHNEKSHNALDIIAEHYSPVIASYSGTVVAAVNSCTDDYPKKIGSGFGNYVVLQHNYTLSNGSSIILYSRYSHLASVSVNKGDAVLAGTQIGKVGSTGFSGGYHLDFQICYGGWSPYQVYSRDPYVNNLLELPGGLNANGADKWCTCCANYVAEVKKLYSGHDPFSWVDEYSGRNGTIYIKGWVADWDDPGAALSVHVYVGGPAGSGVPGYAITANKYRPDVNKRYPGIGDNHGFEEEIEVSPRGNQTLYIYGLNVGGGENILIGTVNVTINEPIHKYSLDINGMLDGREDGGLGNYGTCDVYINGELKADDCNDFYSANGTWEQGSTYEIKDIKATKCHKYEGVHSGSLSGTLNNNTSVFLKFTTAHDYEVKTVKTTCTVLGSKTYTCKNCGDTYIEKDTELLPHDYQKQNIKATCVKPEGTKYTCKNCGHTYTEYAAADWSEWSEKYPDGVDKKLIESRLEYSYSDKQTITSENSSLSGWTQTGSEPVYSEWGGWSAWQTDPITADETVDVASEKVYRYYYFYCPVCGGREPFQGTSDCHQYTLTLSDAHVGWFTVPYSQSNPQNYSYTTAKVYTTAPDGNRWNFSESNLNDTAIGTLDNGNGAVVIATGYRARTRSRSGTKYFYEKWGEWSGWSAEKITESSTRQVKTKTVYHYNRTPYGAHSYDKGNISNNTITYKCINCGETKKIPLITVKDNSGKLTVELATTDKTIAQGIVYGKEDSVTLETLGRTRVAYSKIDSNRSYTFDATKLNGCTIRAYVIYVDKNGKEQVVYSNPYTR